MNDDTIDEEKLPSARSAPRKSDDPNFDASTCLHLRTEGDNNGESCYDCGKQLRGYGYGGWFGSNLTGTEICIHQWQSASPDSEEQVCTFCESFRTKPLHTNVIRCEDCGEPVITHPPACGGESRQLPHDKD